MSRLPAIALWAVLLSGCATTSGREWLNSPIEERGHPSGAQVVAMEEPIEARPRLRKTVTLGETYAVAPQRSAGAAPSGAPSVQVNVQTPVTVNNYGGGYGYGGYGYGYNYRTGYGYGTRTTVGATRSSAPSQKVGADWPAIPSYGPPAMR